MQSDYYDYLEGKAQRAKGRLRQIWGWLTSDKVAFYHGKQERFSGRLKETYRAARSDAEKRLQKFSDRSAA